MNRTTSIVFVALLVSSALAILPTTQASHGLADGSAEFVGLDHEPIQSHTDDDNLNGVINNVTIPLTVDAGDFPEIYGPAAIAVVHVNHLAMRNQATITATVTSGQDSVGEVITLTREATSTDCFNNSACHYFGTFGVESTPTPNNGKIAVSANGIFTLRYNSIDSPSKLEWKPSTSAAIAFTQSVYSGNGTTGVVTVSDADRNFLPGIRDNLAPNQSLKVTSESDPEGEYVQLVETDINSGVFQAQFTFERFGFNGCTGGAEAPETGGFDTAPLCVGNGDRITATYVDLVDDRGYPFLENSNQPNPPTSGTPRVATSFWVQPHTGNLQFMDGTYFAPFAKPFASMAATPKGFLRYEDADLIGLGSIVVRVVSSIDNFGVPVTLQESSPNSGEFLGSFDFTTSGQSSTLPPRLAVATANENGVVGYVEDTINATGLQQLITTAQSSTATVRFMNTDSASAGDDSCGSDVTSALGSVEVCVRQGNGPVPTSVQVFTGRDPVGVSLALTPLAGHVFPDMFHGTLKLETTRGEIDGGCTGGVPPLIPCTQQPNAPAGSRDNTTGADTLLVRNGDTLVALYVDPNNAPGVLVDFAAVTSYSSTVPNGAQAGPTMPRGTLTFRKADFSEVVTGYVDSPSDGTGVEAGFLQAVEPIYNTDPAVPNTMTAVIGSGLEPAMWSAVGDRVDRPTLITLTETDVNSSVFRGNFTIRDTATGPENPDVQVRVGQDAIFAAYGYADVSLNALCTTPSASAPCATDFVGIGTVLAEASWQPRATAVRFRDQDRESLVLPSTIAQECPLLAGTTNPEAYPKCYHGLTTGHIYVPAIFVRPLDRTSAIKTAEVTVRSTSDPIGIKVVVTERYAQGEEAPGFGAPCQGLVAAQRPTVRPGVTAVHQTCDDAFLGTFRFTTGVSNDGLDLLHVADGDAIELDFVTGADQRPDFKKDVARWRAATDATLGTQQPVYRGFTSSASSRVVTVTDADQNRNVNAIDTVNVTMTSDSDLVGVQVTMSETAPASGVFQATFAFSPTASDGATDTIKVKDNDRIAFRYEDSYGHDGEAASHTHVMRWVEENAGLASFTAPTYIGVGAIATLRVTECPTAPGSCLVEPNKTLSTAIRDVIPARVVSDSDGVGEVVLLTETTVDSGIFEGLVGFGQAFAAGDGKLFVRSNDKITAYYVDHDYVPTPASTLDAPKARLATATWSASANLAPTATLQGSPTTGLAPLPVTLTLGASDAEGAISSYALDFGDGSASQVAPGAPPSSLAHTYNAGTFLATLTVTDAAGATGSATVSITVTSPDTTAPGVAGNLIVVPGNITANSVRLRWTAPGDDGATGTVAGYTIKASTAAITSGAFDGLANPANLTITLLPASPAAAGATQEALIAGLLPSTTYNFAMKAFDEASNDGAVSAVVTATTASSDPTAPAGTLVVSSTTHPDNTAVTNNDPVFSWSGLTDPESTITYRYVLNSVAGTVIGATDGTATTGTNVSFTDIAVGSYVFHVRGFSAGGASSTAHYAITIAANQTTTGVTAAQILTANLGIKVTVARSGANNIITWTLPADTPATVTGFQVWRSTSPFVLVADVPAGTAGFAARSFTDANAPANGKYLVTAYYSKTTAGGYSPNGSSADVAGFDSLGAGSAVPGSTSTTTQGSGGSDGVSPWVWVAVAVASALLIALVVLAVVLPRRRKAAANEAKAGESADASAQDDIEWGR